MNVQDTELITPLAAGIVRTVTLDETRRILRSEDVCRDIGNKFNLSLDAHKILSGIPAATDVPTSKMRAGSDIDVACRTAP